MVERTTVARPYAKAVFQQAEEQSNHQRWSDMLAFLAVVAQDEALSRYLDDPKLTSEQRAEVFARVCKGQIDQYGENLVTLLAQNKRLAVLPEIAKQYEMLRAEREQRVDVEVTSAFPLTQDQARDIAGFIKRKLQRDVNLIQIEDRSLIGGVIIRTRDLVIDGSVRGKLAKLADTMNS